MNQFAIAGIQMPVHYGHDNIPAMADQLRRFAAKYGTGA